MDKAPFEVVLDNKKGWLLWEKSPDISLLDLDSLLMKTILASKESLSFFGCFFCIKDAKFFLTILFATNIHTKLLEVSKPKS